MARKYLLTLTEGAGEDEFLTHHVIEAEDRQKVKYHYHRTLKDWGYSPAPWGDKHALQGYRGIHAEIYSIRELEPVEYEVLQKYLTSWAKV